MGETYLPIVVLYLWEEGCRHERLGRDGVGGKDLCLSVCLSEEGSSFRSAYRRKTWIIRHKPGS